MCLGLSRNLSTKTVPSAEGALGFRRGPLEGFFQRLLSPDDSHAAAAAAERGLDDDGGSHIRP